MNTTTNSNHPPRGKRKWDLIIGILLVGFGSFRFYQMLQAPEMDLFRIGMGILFIAYGSFKIYTYSK